VQEFISETDLQTFEGWLRYHAVDAATTTHVVTNTALGSGFCRRATGSFGDGRGGPSLDPASEGVQTSSL